MEFTDNLRLAPWWRRQGAVMRLIAVNVAVFVVTAVVSLFGVDVMAWVALPPRIGQLVFRPWTVVSYMFVHRDIWHLLVNMLWLYWFGPIFLTLCDERQLVRTYLFGGLAGAALYLVGAAVDPTLGGSGLAGASASVIAIVIAAAVLTPDLELPLLILGPVKLKWIAVATLVLFAFGLSGSNAGGHVAHLGGALYGAVMAWRVKRPGALRRSHSKPRKSASPVDDIDPILDKIKRSGYGSLNADERRRLFEASNHLNNH